MGKKYYPHTDVETVVTLSFRPDISEAKKIIACIETGIANGSHSECASVLVSAIKVHFGLDQE